MTIQFHADDPLSSHKDKKANDEFPAFLNKKHGEHMEVKATRGKAHECPGMNLKFGGRSVELDMITCLMSVLEEFPIKFEGHEMVANPAGVDVFEEGKGKFVGESKRELFHRTTTQALFSCERARPDTQPIVSVLCTRVEKPTEKDFSESVRMMKHLASAKNDAKKLSTGAGMNGLQWCVDAGFVVHPDFRSHMGATMKFRDGPGSPIQMSAKQKLNTDSGTTAELAAVHQALPEVLWVPLFLEEQGHEADKNVVCQDNQSAISLEKNGEKSSGECTRHLSIQFFMVTDQAEKGHTVIKCCLTDEMIDDFMTKGPQGIKFEKFRKAIVGHS